MEIMPWLISILTIITIVVILRIRKTILEKKQFSIIQSFAKENNAYISKYDHWHNAFIGIDESEAKKLFFIKTKNLEKVKEIVNLTEVSNCELIKTERTMSLNKNEKVHVMDKIELVFSFFEMNKPNIRFEFYNTEFDHLTLSGELQLAHKWRDLIKDVIKNNKNNFKKQLVLDSGNQKIKELTNQNRNDNSKRKNKRILHEEHFV